MTTKAIGGASAPKNNAQSETPPGLDCKWSVQVAPPGTEVGIQVHSDKDIHVTIAIISIFQWYDNRPHPVEVFKVPFTNKRDVDFNWAAKGANGSDHEKGALYFAVSVGNYRAQSGPLQLRGKGKDQPAQKPIDKFETVVKKKNMPSLTGE